MPGNGRVLEWMRMPPHLRRLPSFSPSGEPVLGMPRSQQMTGLTASLAAFASNQDQAVPPDVAAVIRSGIIDVIGTMIAGREEPVVQLVRAQLAERRGTAQ